MKETLQEVVAILGRGEPAALATILSARGSLPMSRRSKMLVRADGTLAGTIGGGCLEAEVAAAAGGVRRDGLAVIRRFTLTEAQAGAEGLNCGGTVEILVEPLGAGEARSRDAENAFFGEALRALDRGEERVMATLLEEGPPPRVTGRLLVGWRGGCGATGRLSDPDGGLTAQAEEEAQAILGQDRAAMLPLAAGSRLVRESLSAPPIVYLFGGGHVALAVARVARVAGFRIVVVDDRPAFANPERFPEAERTLVLPLDRAVGQLPIDRSSYVVAVTRGHQFDEPVIEQALRTEARYIGMLGSRRKVSILWKRMRERGADEAALARVQAPIGLAIGADTPGEIAVSIVAQLIEARRRRDP